MPVPTAAMTKSMLGAPDYATKHIHSVYVCAEPMLQAGWLQDSRRIGLLWRILSDSIWKQGHQLQ